MADTKISDLTSAGALTGDEVVPIVQSGVTAKLALSALLTWITAALSTALRLIPAGGGTGQYLRKTSIDDYETEWSSAGLVPDSSVAGYVLTQLSGTAGDYAFAAPALTPAAGSGGQIQYNDGANSFAGAALAGIGSSGSLELTVDAAPATPAAGKMAHFARAIAGRNIPAFMGPNGLDSALQPFWGRNKIGFWSPIGNATTAVVGVGIVAPTLINASATSYNVAATSLLTSQRRLGNNSAATAGASGGFRQPTTQFFRSTTDPWGGFFLVIRFAEGTTVTDSRCFVGMYASTGAIGNVNPSTLLNTIGMSYDSGESTWHITHNDGSGVATRIDLGSDYPCNQTTDGYELAVFAPPGQSSVWVQVTRLGTVHSTTLELTTDLPASGVMMAPHINCNNGPTASVKTIVLVTMYVETDY